MSTCISRRAQADRTTIRLTNEKGETGKHIWIEFKCPNVVLDGATVCTACSYKLPKFKYQSNQKCDHGLVGGPYSPDSKLYGSPYYMKELKAGWRLTEEDELRAKAAVDKAYSSMPPRKKTVQDPVVAPVAPLVASPVSPLVALPPKPIKKPGRPRKKTEVILKSPTPVLENCLEPKFIETIAVPISISDFVVVKVKKLECQGIQYYYDEGSGKLYGIASDGVGPYKGRFDKESETVDTTFPDSDCE